MKSYKEYIVESESFRKRFRVIDNKYPGVFQFMSVASRWILRAKRIKNKELRTLLTRLKRKTDIMAFSQKDFRRVYKFIKDKNLSDIESIRRMFADVFHDDGSEQDNKQDNELKSAKGDYEKSYKETMKMLNNPDSFK